ncbi:hypothetical protein [Vulcaniibacterium gelatinicum]|uniref:hypothetical protein n=1 Tax=Vulcaniibacterium gelatinicum TaxID=2598725 RepID=UPI0011C9ADAE|nr:hypothetical protein [Vulcaniibacterium gelatinicum]
MFRLRLAHPSCALLPALLALAACQRPAEPAAPAPAAPATAPTPAPAAAPTSVIVTAVELGKALDAQGRIATPTAIFAPTDAFHATVTARAADPATPATATLGVQWIHADSGQTVHEDTRTLQIAGETTHAFHIARAEGWPPGKYRLEVRLDGHPVYSRMFQVQ